MIIPVVANVVVPMFLGTKCTITTIQFSLMEWN